MTETMVSDSSRGMRERRRMTSEGHAVESKTARKHGEEDNRDLEREIDNEGGRDGPTHRTPTQPRSDETERAKASTSTRPIRKERGADSKGEG